MDQLIYVLYAILILLVFPLSILLYREALPRRKREGNKTKEKIEKVKIKGIIAIIRNGRVLELKKNVKVLEDGTVVVDKNKLWKLPKVDPYIIKGIGFGAKQCIILDANTQAIYEFEEPPKTEKGKINPVVLNPRTLYDYIASGSIRKLLGKITISKGEAILYMFTGMVIIIMMIFFLLPLLGHEIIIR